MPIKVLNCPCESEGTNCVACNVYENHKHSLLADIELDLVAAIAHQKELGIGLKPQDSVWCLGVQSGLIQALGIVEGYEVKK